MRLYDCKVLLAGSRDNEVRKTDVTAAEIMALREIHGPDTVTEIVKKGMDKRVHSAERARIYAIYADAEALDNKAKTARLDTLFGPAHSPLPVELADEEGIDLDEPAPVKRVSQPAKSGKAEDIAAAAALT